MKQLFERIAPFVPEERPASLADISRLYDADPEVFYTFTITDLPSSAEIDVLAFQRLCRAVAIAVRDGFTIDSKVRTQVALGLEGGVVALENFEEDRQFLERLFSDSESQKSITGQPVSNDCVAFYLDDFAWEDMIRCAQLLRLASEDAEAVTAGLPGYQYYQLRDCARQVVRAPAAIWDGVRTDNPKWGTAYCGIPSRSWDNSGHSCKPQDGYVFVVYADPKGFVFDWDWVQADPKESTLPIDHASRFHERRQACGSGELLLGNVPSPPTAFSSRTGFYSTKGDCVFFYFDEKPAYAMRIDDYLTAYFPLDDLANNRSMGFKLKYVSRLIKVVRKYKKGPDEGIFLSYQADRPYIGIDVLFLMQAWLKEGWPEVSELAKAMELMQALEQLQTREVRLPRNVYDEIVRKAA